MPFFQWSEDLALNVKELDDQHRFLIGLVNEFHEAMEAGKGKEILDDVLACMFSYARTHFDMEERLMDESAFPGRTMHAGEHKILQEKVDELIERTGRCDTVVSAEVALFLKEWLREHILKTDMELARHLAATS